MNLDALTIASKLEAEWRTGGVRGPLDGIPLLVEDKIASKDKLQTTAGSWVLQGSIEPRDAYIVSRLRQAEAVFLMGKATLSQWADMRSHSHSEGYLAGMVNLEALTFN